MFSFTGTPPRLTGINTITSAGVTNGQPGNGLDIAYVGPDSYNLIFGFDDVGAVGPANKVAPHSIAFDSFNLGNSFEFELYRNVGAQSFAHVTFGRHGSTVTADPAISGYTCFFAAGLPAGSLPTAGVTPFAGIADGIALVGGQATRLFGSAATVSIDFAQRTGTVRIDLAGRQPPFGEFVGAAAAPIGTATAQLSFASGSGYIDDATLSGPGGSTGTITGQVHAGGTAVGLAFELRFPNGDRLFGAAATERP